jgi:hypothetical protein
MACDLPPLLRVLAGIKPAEPMSCTAENRQSADPTPAPAIPARPSTWLETARDNGLSTSDPSSSTSAFAEVDRVAALHSGPYPSISASGQGNIPTTSIFGVPSDSGSTGKNIRSKDRSNVAEERMSQRTSELKRKPKGPFAPKAYLVNPPAPPKSEPLLTFHRFSELHTEIRLQIWALLDPPPRVLHVSYERQPRGSRVNPVTQEVQWWGTWCIRSPRPLLPNLFICQESRHECRKRYSIVSLLHDNRQKAFFNSATDTLFLNCNTNSDFCRVLPPRYEGSPFSHEVRHLALSREIYLSWTYLDVRCPRCDWRDDPCFEFWNSVRNSMCKLQTVKLVQGGSLVCQIVRRDVFFVPDLSFQRGNDPGLDALRKFFNKRVEVTAQRVWVIEHAQNTLRTHR